MVTLNDADAAGIAEMQFGAGRGRTGTVLLITLGTGIGSALFCDGTLVPNTELGHLYLRDQPQVAEWRAAAAARDRDALKWSQYADRLDEYLVHVERLFSPRLIILGGTRILQHLMGRDDLFSRPRLTLRDGLWMLWKAAIAALRRPFAN